MKYVLFAFVFGVYFLKTQETKAQNKEKIDWNEVNIISVKLTKESYRALSGMDNDMYSLDKEGRLVPMNGHILKIDRERKNLIISKNGNETRPLNGIGIIDLGKGRRIWCTGGCRECIPTYNTGSKSYKCDTSGCPDFCSMVVEFPSSDATEFQTPNGNYNNFGIN
ncbi:MAG: hypothetical protein JJU28_22490 [Cyclobacteriaceae bacterium]|nr:hypothetical protein [Cyclobacteriaceae bacterium]